LPSYWWPRASPDYAQRHLVRQPTLFKKHPRSSIRTMPGAHSKLCTIGDITRAKSMARLVYEPEPASALIRRLRICRSPVRLMPKQQPDLESDPNQPGARFKVLVEKLDTGTNPQLASSWRREEQAKRKASKSLKNAMRSTRTATTATTNRCSEPSPCLMQPTNSQTTPTGCLQKGDEPARSLSSPKTAAPWDLQSTAVKLNEHIGHEVSATGTIASESKRWQLMKYTLFFG